MGVAALSAAVFLDRDGVLTQLVVEPETGEYVSPNRLEQLRMLPNLVGPLKRLSRAGFELFIVSNQPSCAKGKTSLDALRAIGEHVDNCLRSEGVQLTESFYCYHHPLSVVPELAVRCECRKPGAQFLTNASRRWGIDLKSSWIVGDRAADMECGRRVGCATLLIPSPASAYDQPAPTADRKADDLARAAEIIVGRGSDRDEGAPH